VRRAADAEKIGARSDLHERQPARSARATMLRRSGRLPLRSSWEAPSAPGAHHDAEKIEATPVPIFMRGT
jgi:hypothetical protein